MNATFKISGPTRNVNDIKKALDYYEVENGENYVFTVEQVLDQEKIIEDIRNTISDFIERGENYNWNPQYMSYDGLYKIIKSK